MATTKKRVNLYVDAEPYDRLKALTKRVPGMTISGVFDQVLREFVPVVEQLVDLAQSGDREAQALVARRLLADQMFTLASEGADAIHTMEKREVSTS